MLPKVIKKFLNHRFWRPKKFWINSKFNGRHKWIVTKIKYLLDFNKQSKSKCKYKEKKRWLNKKSDKLKKGPPINLFLRLADCLHQNLLNWQWKVQRTLLRKCLKNSKNLKNIIRIKNSKLNRSKSKSKTWQRNKKDKKRLLGLSNYLMMMMMMAVPHQMPKFSWNSINSKWRKKKER